MFGIGTGEMLMIAVVLLLAVGPTRMPSLMKALVSGYREFRRAARELRASTGIDEILQDEDLRSLRKPLTVPPPKKRERKLGPISTPAHRARPLTFEERRREDPPAGVDVVEAEEAEERARADREGAGPSRANPVGDADPDDAVRRGAAPRGAVEHGAVEHDAVEHDAVEHDAVPGDGDGVEAVLAARGGADPAAERPPVAPEAPRGEE
ncbi:MAG: twin-arginine translocase TatA/TatE family subunit [Sandaracinaceae bacterium]